MNNNFIFFSLMNTLSTFLLIFISNRNIFISNRNISMSQQLTDGD